MGELRLERLGDAGMQALAVAVQQAGIGGVAHQGVLEGIGGLWRRAAAIDQAGGDQLVERAAELALVERGHRGEQFVGEGAAERGAELGDGLGAGQPVEPRHQRVLQAGRNLELDRLDIVRVALEQRPGDLLDEQRHAVGLADDLLDDRGRQGPRAGDLGDERQAPPAVEPLEPDRQHMGIARPGRIEARPEGDHDEDRQGLGALDQPAEQGQRAGIEQAGILEIHHHRAARRQAGEMVEQCSGHALALLLRLLCQRRIARLGRDPEQGSDRRRGLRPVRSGAGEQPLELGQPARRRVGGVQAGAALQQLDHAVEGGVLVIGRAVIAEAIAGFAAQAFEQRLHQARLAHARLARQQHDLAAPRLRLRPAAADHCQLALAPDEGGERALMQRLEAAPRAALADHVPGRDGGRDALQLVLAEIGALEQRMDQLAGRGADHHAVGLGDPLQPRREVGGLADHRMPALRPAADQLADHYQAGGDADAGLQRHARDRPQLVDRGDDRERRPDRALGIVLMGMRIAEIDQHAVAEILRDGAVEAADQLGGTAVKGGDDGLQILGIEPVRQRRRADQVAEHDGELAALRGGVAAGILDGGGRFRRGQLQRHAAIPAEARIPGIESAAGRTARERQPAAAAEIAAAPQAGAAPWAIEGRHGLPDRRLVKGRGTLTFAAGVLAANREAAHRCVASRAIQPVSTIDRMTAPANR